MRDECGPDGWAQTITGTVYNAAHTNVPHYTDTGFADVLALTDASLQMPDGSALPLAGGRLVLARFDRMLTAPVINVSPDM